MLPSNSSCAQIGASMIGQNGSIPVFQYNNNSTRLLINSRLKRFEKNLLMMNMEYTSMEIKTDLWFLRTMCVTCENAHVVNLCEIFLVGDWGNLIEQHCFGVFTFFI